jgi:hypothetical protein
VLSHFDLVTDEPRGHGVDPIAYPDRAPLAHLDPVGAVVWDSRGGQRSKARSLLGQRGTRPRR